MTWVDFSYLILAVACTVLSSTIIKVTFKDKKFRMNLNTLKVFIKNPVLMIAVAMCIVASVSWANVIVHSVISIAIPIYTSLLFLMTFLIGYISFDEKISKEKVIGILFIICGISVILKFG